MKQLTPVQLSQNDATLKILSGPDKGAEFKMLAPQVSIGRGTDNDIVLKDSKCSRRHAVIRRTPQNYEVHDVSDKNRMLVNGVECKSALLEDKARLQIGDTEIRFHLDRRTEISIVPPRPQPAPVHPANPTATSTRTPSFKKKKGLSPAKLGMGGAVLLLLILLLSGPSKKRDEELKLRTEEQIQADIEAANKIREAAEKQRKAEGPSGTEDGVLPFEEAQGAYVRGFRDYKKGQFDRAIESFQACLSLYPSHALCGRYLKISIRRFNELVQYHMILGRKYKDQDQYSACLSAFRNVMVLVKDTNSVIYKEAKANYEVCQTYMQERF